MLKGRIYFGKTYINGPPVYPTPPDQIFLQKIAFYEAPKLLQLLEYVIGEILVNEIFGHVTPL